MTILTSLFGLLLLLQEAAASPEAGASSANTFTLTEMVKNMGGVAIAVVIVLLIMSVYSIAQLGCRYALLDSSAVLLDHLRTDLVVVSRQQTTIVLRSTFPRECIRHAIRDVLPLAIRIVENAR